MRRGKGVVVEGIQMNEPDVHRGGGRVRKTWQKLNTLGLQRTLGLT